VLQDSTIWQKLPPFLSRFIIKLAIKYKWLRKVHYTEDELNELLTTSFPQTLPVNVANSDAELTLLNAELSMPMGQNKLHLQMYCAFKVMVAGKDIYRAHLIVSGSALPYYDPENTAIRIKALQLSDVRLVNDDYAFIGSTTDLATLFMPKAFKNLLLGTVHVTLSVLKGFVPKELMNYLNLYSSGSKQKVLDFHKPEIEHILINKVEQEDWYYEMDETEFEERIFAEFGQHVAVEDGELIFKFHLD